MGPVMLAAMWVSFSPHLTFPGAGVANEEIFLRWIHFISGITWIGLLYFFNLVGFPTMKQLDPAVRAKIYPGLMARAMWWFRWSALVTVVVGLRYFFIILSTDAHNAGNPSLAWQWLGWWFLVWMAAYALIFPLQLPAVGAFDNAWLRATAIAIVLIAAAWAVMELNSGAEVSNSHLCISVGGGLGLLMLLNAWGVVWRAQKRLIAWTIASTEHGARMPAEAARLTRWAFIASRAAFWMSFPMLFFMGAAEHYPFLSSMMR